MNFQNASKQQGFTLIELIIVIIILGILAVTAAPKFLDIQNDARRSAVSGIAGAVRSASQIVRSGVLVGKLGDMTGSPAGTNDAVILENVNYRVAGGYLTAGEVCRIIDLLTVEQTTDATGASAALSSDGAYDCDYETDTAGTGSDNDVVRIYPTAQSAAGTCHVTYIDASGTASTPEISSVTTGC